jgi:hypothetical protein
MVNLHRGHQFLSQTFDYSPRTAWSLETTGNSAAVPRLSIESLFVLNVQPDERKERLKYAEMEFLWRPMYGHLGQRPELLGHVFYDFFTSPLDLLVLDRP